MRRIREGTEGGPARRKAYGTAPPRSPRTGRENLRGRRVPGVVAGAGLRLPVDPRPIAGKDDRGFRRHFRPERRKALLFLLAGAAVGAKTRRRRAVRGGRLESRVRGTVAVGVSRIPRQGIRTGPHPRVPR